MSARPRPVGAGWLRSALFGACLLLAHSHGHAAIAFRAAASSAITAGTTALTAHCVQTSGGANTSYTLSMSSGSCSGTAAAGNVVIAHLVVRGTPTITAPAGWTLVSTSSTSNLTQAVYWQVATSSSISATWTFSSSQRAVGALSAFSSVDSVAAISAYGSQTATSSTTVTAPSQTQSQANSMLVALFGVAHGGSSFGTATAMTEAYEGQGGSSTSGVSLAMDYQLDPSAGATGNKTAAVTSADNIGHLLVLKPGGASISLPVPTGSTANDVMVATLAYRDRAVTIGAPTGWTLVNQAIQPTSGTNGMRLDTYYRVAGASEPASYSWSFSGGNFEFAVGSIASFSGVDTAAPVNAQAGQAAGNGTSWSFATPTITPTVDGSMLVAGFALLNAGTWTPPAGFSEATDVRSPSAGAEVGIQLEVAYRLQSTAAAVSATAVASNTYSADYGATQILALRPGSSGPDHYELSLPTASLACLPTTVTVTACANGSSPCTSPFAGASGATATLTTAGATLGSGTVTFDASGLATTTLSHPSAANGTAVSVTLSGESLGATNARQCCPNGGSCSAANSCSTTFNTAGFIVAASAGGAAATVPTQTAGTSSGSYVLRAVQTNTTTKACESALTGSTTVNWALQCQNPTTCSPGNLMTLTGNAATAIASNPASGITGTTAVAMTFDANGNAPFSFAYADVGQVLLSATKTVNSATLTGTTNGFVVRPASFSITNLRQTASPNTSNPAAASAAGGVFVKAGESFSATVTALTSGGAATPNFGREATPEGVLLTPTLVLPAGGTNGTLANATIAGGSFSAGAATVTTLSYSEVGIVTLTPSVADGSYLGTGAVSGTATGNVGRFVPARFALSGTSVTHRSGLACAPASAFTYLGETFRIGVTLTAQNVAGATTANYAGSFARFDPTSASAWQLAGRDGATVFTVASGRLSLGSATGSWAAGVAGGATITAAALRAASPDGPFSAAFGIAPVDSDGVALGSFDLASAPAGANDRATVGTLGLRFGRLRLSNAIGAADRPLPLPATLQYWSGSSWDTNTLDSCTAVATSAMSFGNLRRTLTTADTAAVGALSFSAGRGTLTLAAPGGGRSGTVDVALSLGTSAADASCLQPWTPGSGDAASSGANLAHLRGAWCAGNFDKDPSARASFGLQRTQDNVIYRREHY